MSDGLARQLDQLGRLSDKVPLPDVARLKRLAEARRRRLRVLRTATVLLVLAAIAVPIVLLGPRSTTRLGLRSHSSVVATYVPTVSYSSTEDLSADARTMTLRLKGLGYPQATAEARNGSIVVTAPNHLPRSILRAATSTGVLQFRPVLCLGGLYAPEKTSSSLEGCSANYVLSKENLNVNVQTGQPQNDIGPDPSLAPFPSSTPAFNDSNPTQIVLLPATSSSSQNETRYLLGPSALSNEAIASAHAVFQASSWVVDVNLTNTGSVAWDELAQEQFHAYIAVDLDGQVISASLVLPTESTFISFGGKVQISANFPRTSATGLASILNAGSLQAPLQLSATTCAPNQLTGTVAFNATQSELGAINLSNTSSQSCSLSGRPTVTILGDNGLPLSQNETTYHRAPDWPPPTSPIVLSASGALPQAVVELDWVWCGSTPHQLEVQVRFPTWSSPLDIPGTSISPSGFSPATCSSTGLSALFSVDDVRGFGQNGIIGPS